jgi:hypothetical protein
MNERLKELAEQAGLEELNDSDWCSLNHPDVRAEHLERFADLVRQDYLRELKALKPVAWLTTEPFAQTGISITTVTLHQQISGTPLYALDEVTK